MMHWARVRGDLGVYCLSFCLMLELAAPLPPHRKGERPSQDVRGPPPAADSIAKMSGALLPAADGQHRFCFLCHHLTSLFYFPCSAAFSCSFPCPAAFLCAGTQFVYPYSYQSMVVHQVCAFE